MVLPDAALPDALTAILAAADGAAGVSAGGSAALAVGGLAYDIAHLLSGAMLLTSFGLIYQRRLAALIDLFALHAFILAAAAAWQGYVQDAPHLYATAAIALIFKAILIPLALNRMVRKLQLHDAVETTIGIVSTMLIGVALVGLSIMLVLPMQAMLHLPPGLDPTSTAAQQLAVQTLVSVEELGIALAIVLIAMLTMITRRNAVSQVIGYMTLENGLMLAAVGAAGMPLVVELSVALSVLVAFFIFGMFFFRIRERFDSLDVAFLDSFRGDHQ